MHSKVTATAAVAAVAAAAAAVMAEAAKTNNNLREKIWSKEMMEPKTKISQCKTGTHKLNHSHKTADCVLSERFDGFARSCDCICLCVYVCLCL